MKKLLLVATALCLPSQAFAQDTIVVTARKIQESIKDAPVSVLHYSQQELENAGIRELEEIPNVGFRPVPQNGSGMILSMRGQTQNDVSVTVDPSVATYIDNNYIGRGYGLNGPLIDINNVQVIKGPQGVLFGRNSTAGAVVINTNSPNLSNTSMDTEYSIGRFSEHRVTSVVNIPVNNILAFRVAGAYDYSDGYSKNSDGNRYSARDNYYVRAKGLLDLGDNKSLELSGDYFNSDTTLAPKMMLYGYGRLSGLVNANYKDNVSLDSGLVNDTETGSVYGTFNYNSVKLTAGWRTATINYRGDFDGTSQNIYYLDNRVNVDQYTAELLNTDTIGKLTYTTGAFFFQEKGAEYGFASYYGGFNNTLQGGTFNNKSYGVFTSAIYSVSSNFNVNVGIRYTRDNKQFISNNGVVSFNRSYLSCFSRDVIVSNNCALSQRASFNKVSWSVGADYTFSSNDMVYIKIGTGYKSGGNQIRAVSVNNDRLSFDPENVTEYELGLKGSKGIFDYNTAIFYNQTSNLQVLSVVTSPVVYTLVTNAAKTRAYGVEADIRINVTNNFSLSGYASLVRPKYLAYTDPISGADLTTNRFNNVTRNQFSVAANYRRNNVNASIAYFWYDKTDKLSTPLTTLVNRYGQVEGQKIYNTTVVPAYGVLNANIGYTLNNRYTVSIWGRNIFNERVFTDMVPLEGLFNSSSLNDPATYGISIKVRL